MFIDGIAMRRYCQGFITYKAYPNIPRCKKEITSLLKKSGIKQHTTEAKSTILSQKQDFPNSDQDQKELKK